VLSWGDAQEQFSLGAEAMSQGSGSPIAFLDPGTCDNILAYIRRPDGTLPDFGSIPSEPGLPPPALEGDPPRPGDANGPCPDTGPGDSGP